MPAEENCSYKLLSPQEEEVFLRALIFAAGDFKQLESNPILREQDDIVIAADGGTHHCLSMGIRPDIIIGDLDSLTTDDQNFIESSEIQVKKYPIRKDFTDLELALQHACYLNADEILIYGGLGFRWDQTLANILLLLSPSLICNSIKLIDGKQEIYLADKSKPIHISGKPGDIVSLIPISGDAIGITTTNLEYELNKETLYFGASRGVSNVMTNSTASISLTDGRLICILIQQ